MRGPLAGLALTAAASLLAFALADACAACLSAPGGPAAEGAAIGAEALLGHVMSHGLLSFEQMPLAAGLACFAAVWLAYSRIAMRRGSFRRGEEHGSAAWLDPKEAARRFRDRRRPDNNVILTKHVHLAVDQSSLKEKDRRARNVIVVGGTGSGKTFSYLIPNALQLNCDFLITDTKGDLHGKLGWVLEEAGYDVRVFNTKDPASSNLYNMIAYLKGPSDVSVFVTALMSATDAAGERRGDQFWDQSTWLILCSAVSYLVEHCPEADRNMEGLLLLLSLAQPSEQDEGFTCPYELLMREIAEGSVLVRSGSDGGGAPRSRRAFRSARPFAYRWERVAEPVEPVDDFSLLCWTMLKAAAGKTLKSVIVSANVRLQSVMVPEIRRLTRADELALDGFGEAGRKKAVFAVASDTTETYSPLMNMLVWQTVHLSTEKADREHGGRLPRPLHLMLDEFYNLGRLANVEHIVTTVRSRDISLSILLQSVAQLEARYGADEAQIIEDNCDTLLFLGGKSTKTNQMIAEMAGKATVDAETWSRTRGDHGSSTLNRSIVERDLVQAAEAGRLDRGRALLLISGCNPVLDEKFAASDHARWDEVAGHEGSRRDEPWEPRRRP